VEGKTTMGYGHAGQTLVTYDDSYIMERSKMIQLAIDARRQKYPEETQYSYQPFGQYTSNPPVACE